MDIMDIAGLSTGMSQAKVVTDVSTAMLAKSLDMMETIGNEMAELMESSVVSNLGGNIDVMV